MSIKALTGNLAKTVEQLISYNQSVIEKNQSLDDKDKRKGTILVIYPFVTKLTGKSEQLYQKIKGAKNIQSTFQIKEKNEQKAHQYIESLNLLHNKLW